MTDRTHTRKKKNGKETNITDKKRGMRRKKARSKWRTSARACALQHRAGRAYTCTHTHTHTHTHTQPVLVLLGLSLRSGHCRGREREREGGEKKEEREKKEREIEKNQKRMNNSPANYVARRSPHAWGGLVWGQMAHTNNQTAKPKKKTKKERERKREKKNETHKANKQKQ
eukprot:TRINITY_DN300_c2_g1_i1.p4 TRINITY_DN300_c2_g1~~TRINITY_DN300_c2_g1_i1.p4  ORF type:complete len:171 (+),score=19.74 TRINITY_DN300_c2_g1_i1:146-658(+)